MRNSIRTRLILILTIFLVVFVFVDESEERPDELAKKFPPI